MSAGAHHASTLYALVSALTRHVDNITCLAFAPQSDLLASGGDDGNIILWDVSLGKILHWITTSRPITSLAWDPSEWRRRLFVGGTDGLLAIMENFKEQEPADSILTGVKAPVYAITIDPSTGHMAIALGSEVHVAKALENHRVTVAGRKYATFKILPMPPKLPSSQKPSKTLDNHRWHISLIHSHQLVGHAALSPDESSVLLFNLSDGLDLYTVGQNHPQQSYKFSHSGKANVPVQVAFIEHGQAVLSGSLDGNVHVWDLAFVESRQVHEYDDCIVQAVAAFDCFDYSIIATATAYVPDPSSISIKLWRSK
ncbi:WD40 repeat-like protein [Suillus hirtellus]|nr:WD40 repeat-like protein [Suillus hirtellus]